MQNWGLIVTGIGEIASHIPFNDVLWGRKKKNSLRNEFALRIKFTVNTKSFLNNFSFTKPILHTPGTAQIGEGIENSWGDLEESEREEAVEEEDESEAAAFEDQKMETEETSTVEETKSTMEETKGRYFSTCLYNFNSL